MSVISLNFPPFDFSTRTDEQKKLIFDRVRKKIIPLTPEEWVRQHCIEMLIEYLNVSPNLIAIERQITVNNLTKRFDIVSFRPSGNAQVLVECKSTDVALDDLVITQAANYLSIVDSEYLWLCNGINHIWMIKTDSGYKIIDFPKTLG